VAARSAATLFLQKTEDQLRREAPQLIFCFYVLSKPCFAIQTIWIGLLQKCGTNGEKYFWRKSEPIKGLHWNFCKETTSRARVTGNIANLLDFDQNYIAIAIVIELFQLLNMS